MTTRACVSFNCLVLISYSKVFCRLGSDSKRFTASVRIVPPFFEACGDGFSYKAPCRIFHKLTPCPGTILALTENEGYGPVGDSVFTSYGKDPATAKLRRSHLTENTPASVWMSESKTLGS
ncbi:hypothetical protein BASA62_003907 [Batrachochytrium salamandrivorans]|nr:hypothetical protein BASA62_003907 [Batrachochytrium salamandrivorans]